MVPLAATAQDCADALGASGLLRAFDGDTNQLAMRLGASAAPIACKPLLALADRAVAATSNADDLCDLWDELVADRDAAMADQFAQCALP